MKKKTKILIFGNPIVKRDRIALVLAQNLRKEFPQIQFKEFDAVEDLQKEGQSLYIIDAVDGVNDVTVITDVNSIIVNKIYSVHDFDLGYYLKLLKKMDMIKQVVIFCIPIRVRKELALKQLKQKIRSTLLLESG
ncbi:MAG TPA: hypothetical protein VFJ05_06005 [Nitrososphaeraceae archaeon]|nr:hypothetical protein [Nitrososphaeraceae archaeon]